MLHTEISGRIIALNDGSHKPADIARILINGQAVELHTAAGLDPADAVDLTVVAASLRKLAGVVGSQFVEREELIDAFLAGLVANEHTFALSRPGTAKTSVVKVLTKGFSGRVWGTVMNPDLPRDSMVGTIDPAALSGGKWTRRWAGIATADIAIIDEVWKSSAQNANILLDALEERKVREGDDEISIPLISALSMSNEVPEDSDRAAIFDRFLIRLSINYISDSGNFMSMLTAAAGSVPVSAVTTTDHLRLFGAAAEVLALNAPAKVLKTVQALWRDLGQNGRQVSDRRWRRTLKLAAAYSLLKGEAFGPGHLIVGKWTLWQEADDEASIRELILSKTDPMMGEVLSLEALLSDLNNSLGKLDKTDMAAKAELAGKAGKLKGMAVTMLDEPEAGQHTARIEKVRNGADEIMNKVVTMF